MVEVGYRDVPPPPTTHNLFNTKDYVTEKTYNALKQNTIPIVLGGVNYTRELPPGTKATILFEVQV